MPTVILDNGSYELKIGPSGSVPRRIPNCIARSKTGEYLIDAQIHNHSDASLYLKRPFEQGQLTSWELERSIWDYSLGTIGVKEPGECDLVLSETPYTLPQLSINTDQIVFEEFGFEHYFRAPLASFVPWVGETDMDSSSPAPVAETNAPPYAPYRLVIDCGFNATWIVPVIHGVTHWAGVKKFAIAGRLLNGYLRELISYRHYNLMDETLLVNDIKEKTCFVAPENFPQMVRAYHQQRAGASGAPAPTQTLATQPAPPPIVRYALPDFKSSNRGYVVDGTLPHDDTRQILTLLDERIAVPEVLFHPELANVLSKPGLIQHILEAIELCPALLRPLLVANMVLIGGTAEMAGLGARIERELRKELPEEWLVRVTTGASGRTYGWHAMDKFVSAEGFDEVKVSKKEYFEHGSNWCQQRFGWK